MMKCEYFEGNRCRSCELIGLPYSEQLQEKARTLRQALELAPEFETLPPMPSQQFTSRMKAKLSVGGSSDSPVLGLLRPADLGTVDELLSCPLHHPELNRLLEALPAFIQRVPVAPYQIREKRGELKSVIAFRSPESGEMYLRFVLRSRESLDRLRREVPKLQEAFPELQCVSANLQPIPHAILEGEEEIFLSKRHSITHRLGSISYELAPNAFVQTNHEVSKRLYGEAANWIAELNSQRFCELYSGQGAFSFFAAPGVQRGLGIEVNSAAVAAANSTAQNLGLKHLQFSCADATLVLQRVMDYKPDVILVNPPRRGLGEGRRLLELSKPRYVIYSSCSVDSLAEDLRRLNADYRLERVQLFDMFPNTRHFETLALLSSVKAV